MSITLVCSFLYLLAYTCHHQAMVTRKGDQLGFAANLILRSLIHAEMTNITQANADELRNDEIAPEVDLISAIRAVGNYGEIYARHMEEVVPRKGLNLLYNLNEENQFGLHYSHPLGTIDTFRHEFAADGKINTILERGKLICGVYDIHSMETDYCRALSGSLFSGNKNLVELVKMPAKDDVLRMKLDSGQVDVVAGVPVGVKALLGLAFSQPYYFDG